MKPREPRATGNAALQRRLRKQFPELHAAVLHGDITANAAAVAAGFRRRRGQRLDPSNNDWDEAISIATRMWLGPLSGDEAERALWVKHRTRLLGWFGGNGCRPMAWWKYESPIPWPGLGRARSALYEHGGLLEKEEAHQLEKEWRREFDKAHAPGFFYCEGPERFLEGRQARVAHFVHCDIPVELVERWAAEREGFSDPAPDVA